MRLIALYALLATASLVSCERRNPDRCNSSAEKTCPDGRTCLANFCVAPECDPKAQTGCMTSTAPICAENGLCIGCSADDQCSKSVAGAPFCLRSRCVACRGNADCASPLSPVCDLDLGRCRPCARHTECGGGVCAKDELLASPPGPLAIQKGACVPPERVLFVDPGCRAPALCTPGEALDKVSPAQPYIVLRGGQGSAYTRLTVPGTMNTSGLKVVHLIGAMADSSPSRADTPPTTFGAPVTTALTVNPGYRVVVEGVAIQGGIAGVECIGTGKAAETELRLQRVVIGEAATAVKTNECKLLLEESWIGAGFGQIFRGMIGNGLAMSLMNSEFSVVNSVLFRNGLRDFGGIYLSYDPMWKGARSSIINSTIASHTAPTGTGAVSLDCNSSVSDRLVIFNTLIVNDALNFEGTPTRHIADTCQPLLGAVATNDDRLVAAAAPGFLVKGQEAAGLRNVKAGDLCLLSDAPAAVLSGGTARFQSGAIDLAAPTTDMAGSPRPRYKDGQVSIGSFEVCGP